MAIAHVQTKAANTENSAHTTLALTFDSSATSGNLIVVSVGYYPAARSITSVTDSQGNTYTAVAAVFTTDAGDPHEAQIYYAKNISGGSSFQITVTYDSSLSYSGMSASEYSGLDTTAPLDAHSETSAQTAGNPLAATWTSASFTTTVADELIYVFGMSNNGAAGPLAAGSGYTMRTTSGYAGRMGAMDQIVSATQSSVTATMTDSFGGSMSYGMAVATFKIAGAGGGGGGASCRGRVLLLGVGRC